MISLDCTCTDTVCSCDTNHTIVTITIETYTDTTLYPIFIKPIRRRTQHVCSWFREKFNRKPVVAPMFKPRHILKVLDRGYSGRNFCKV